MRHIITAALFASSLAMMPASHLAAQSQNISPSDSFLKAVKKGDGDEVTSILRVPGNSVINSHQGGDGRTAMHLVVEQRDLDWIKFLLANHANPNLGDKDGDTPLMLATQLSYLEGMETLLTYGGKVDEPNRAGETPLIRAVQLHDTEAVRLLMKHGANPAIKDHVSGRSALDYARRDGRSSTILNLLDAKPEAKAKQQGELDFSGIE